MHAIYKIQNISDHKFYVGSSVDFNKRKEIHIYQLRTGTHSNKHLLNAWRKFGESSFVFEILEIVKNPASLLEREQYYIDSMDACDLGYNIQKIAKSRFGSFPNEQTIIELSLKLSGDKNPMFGINVYETWIKKYGYVEATKKWEQCNIRRSSNGINKGTKKIIQLSKCGEIISEFDSITSASIITGTNLSSITQVCKGNRKSASGYRWEYKNKINK